MDGITSQRVMSVDGEEIRGKAFEKNDAESRKSGNK